MGRGSRREKKSRIIRRARKKKFNNKIKTRKVNYLQKKMTTRTNNNR